MAPTNRRRLPIVALSVAGHAGVLLAVLAAQPTPQAAPELPPISVALVELPRPPPPPPPEPPKLPAPSKEPAPKAAPKPAPPKPPPPRRMARPTPPRLDVVPIPAGKPSPVDGTGEVTEAELAGATTAGSGSGAGSGAGACNMTRRLQAALRKDRLVQAALADAHRGRALRVWDGDWVRHGAQEGAGLAAVREAILWEVGFAPQACRAEAVHGMVLISLNDTPGSARIVVGAGSWRWSDLLRSRAAR